MAGRGWGSCTCNGGEDGVTQRVADPRGGCRLRAGRNVFPGLCPRSGSTRRGRPGCRKPSCMRTASVPAVARCGIEVFGIDASDRLFAPSRLFFAYPLANSLFTGLACGATVILQREWPTVDNVAVTAARDRPTVFFGVPAFYRALLREGSAAADCARHPRRGFRRRSHHAGAGGAMAGRDRRTDMGRLRHDGNARADARGATAFGRCDGASTRPGCRCGVRVCGRRVAPADIEAPTVALGYRNREAESARPSFPAGFTPGDRFAPAGDGWRYAGRTDTLVKVRGRWVSLPDVEAAIVAAAGPTLREIALVALADEDGLTTLAAAYVSEGDATAASAALGRALAPLPPYQRPTRCVAFAALPRTVTGKLLRRELVARLRTGRINVVETLLRPTSGTGCVAFVRDVRIGKSTRLVRRVNFARGLPPVVARRTAETARRRRNRARSRSDEASSRTAGPRDRSRRRRCRTRVPASGRSRAPRRTKARHRRPREHSRAAASRRCSAAPATRAAATPRSCGP